MAQVAGPFSEGAMGLDRWPFSVSVRVEGDGYGWIGLRKAWKLGRWPSRAYMRGESHSIRKNCYTFLTDHNLPFTFFRIS